MPKESTTIKITMETHISLEALKEEGYFSESTTFNDIIKELADFFRQNKMNIEGKIQYIQLEITGLRQQTNFTAKTLEKQNEMLVRLKGDFGKLEKRVEKLENKQKER
jgi:BMFP domain-containing protein YqiC